MSSPRLLGVLVTYRRPALLASTLAGLAAQSRRIDRLVVVDNDDDPALRAAVAESDAAEHVDYIGAPTNLGPAGAIALGMERHLAETTGDDDWIVLLDDDDPPPTETTLDRLWELALSQRLAEPAVAAVGLTGARTDLRRGRVHRLTDEELAGVVVVDHIGGGMCPLYRTGPLRAVGPARADLFFGFDDLELGLRLTRAGYVLVADGDDWLARRAARGRLDRGGRPSAAVGLATWRRYYSIRNLIVVLRDAGATRAALRVTLVSALAKPLLNLPRRPSLAWTNLCIGARASRDAWLGRLGRTVEPAAQ